MRTIKSISGDVKSCADCGEYVPRSTLIAQTDGREVCLICDKTARDAAFAKAQLEMFHQQERLFE
jgi:formylmethanofuran dehydrogenase subunit E